MENGADDFEKLRKLLTIKQHEQPPPGYFNRFSGLVISRIERESEPQDAWAEAPWLQKLLRIFESSPVVGGIFGAGLCALVVFGIAMANQADRVPAGTFTPVANAGPDANNGNVGDTVAMVARPGSSMHSTDAMFGTNIFGGNGGVTAQIESVSFSPASH